MQGPFRGVAGQLSRAFGGAVTLRYGTPQARDVSAIFRRLPRMVDAHHGAEVETMVPVLRASRLDLEGMVEGDVVDPKDGRLYRFLFVEDSQSPAPDALVTAQLEDLQ